MRIKIYINFRSGSVTTDFCEKQELAARLVFWGKAMAEPTGKSIKNIHVVPMHELTQEERAAKNAERLSEPIQVPAELTNS